MNVRWGRILGKRHSALFLICVFAVVSTFQSCYTIRTGSWRKKDTGLVKVRYLPRITPLRTENQTAIEFKVDKVIISKVNQEEFVKKKFRVPTWLYISTGIGAIALWGTGGYMWFSGVRNRNPSLERTGRILIYSGDGLGLITVGFWFFNGRTISSGWRKVEEGFEVKSLKPASFELVELKIQGKGLKYENRIQLDDEGKAKVPLFGKYETASIFARIKDQEFYDFVDFKKAPPDISVVNPPSRWFETSDEVVELSGVASSPDGIRRVAIGVGGGGARESASEFRAWGKKEFKFSTAVVLKEGINQVIVEAESEAGSRAKEVIYIYRKPSVPEVFAVVVGVSDYMYLPDLKFPSQDARDFSEILIRSGIPTGNIKVLLDSEATLKKVKQSISELKKADKDDTVIFFFSGHGGVERDPNSPDGDGFSKYLLVYDTHPEKLFATGLAVWDIWRVFSGLRTKNILVFIDSCYSGGVGGRTPFAEKVEINDLFLRKIAGEGRMIFSASGVLELARESEELSSGIFSYFLRKGLEGDADLDGDGKIHTSELAKYIVDQVKKYTKGLQNPAVFGFADFSFAIP